MQIVTVIPIAKGVFKERLTYWSPKDIPIGSIVEVSVRSQKIPALIVGKEPLLDAKTKIKSSSFSLKKITSTKPKILFSESFIRTAEKMASFSVSSTGVILGHFLPKNLLLAMSAKPHKGFGKSDSGPKFKIEKLAFQAPDDERFASYKSLVREEFARKNSVLFMFPTIRDAKKALSLFEKGIKEYTYAFHGGLSTKETSALWKKLLEEDHPVVIITTPPFLNAMRNDIKTIVVENENHGAYRTITRPYFDIRTFAEYLAKELGIRIIFGGMMLRAETIHRFREHEILEFTGVKFRSLSSGTTSLVDMRPYWRVASSFTTISNELRALIELNRREHGRTFILTGRRGTAPSTVCGDCGTLVRCGDCGNPFVLHKNSKGKMVFLCHRCGGGREVALGEGEKCSNCSSWKLSAMGIGIERVVEELGKMFPGTPIFRIDADKTKTENLAEKVSREFFATEGSILVGTEMSISFLTRRVGASAIIGVDSLLTIPDIRINERVMAMALSIRDKTEKSLVIETSNPENPLFLSISRGDLLSFYKDELAERKNFGFPPFGTIITISLLSGDSTQIKDAENLKSLFKDYEPAIYGGSESGGKRQFIRALIRLPKGGWVDEKLSLILKTLPPKYLVSVNPENIL